MSEGNDDILSDGEVADEPCINASDREATAVETERYQTLGISAPESSQLDNTGASSDTRRSKRHDKKEKSHRHKKKHHHRHSSRSEHSPSVSQKHQESASHESENTSSSHVKHGKKRHHQHSQHSDPKKAARMDSPLVETNVSKRSSMDMERYGAESPLDYREAFTSQYGYESDEYEEGSEETRAEQDFYYDSDDGRFNEGSERDSFARRGRRGGRRGSEFFSRRSRFPTSGAAGNFNRTPCIYFKEGRCGKGDQCTFSHDIPQRTKLELCKFYATTSCLKGPTCLYLHKEFPCKFYHYQGSCKLEDECLFSHAEMTPVMKNLLERFIHDKPFRLKGETEETSDSEQTFHNRDTNPNEKCSSSLLGPPPSLPDRSNDPHSPPVHGRSRGGPYFPSRAPERRPLSPDRMLRNEIDELREDVDNVTMKKADSQSKEREGPDYDRIPPRREDSDRYYREDEEHPDDEESEDFYYYHQQRPRLPPIQSQQYNGPSSHGFRPFSHPMGPPNSRVPFLPPNAPFRPGYRSNLPPPPPYLTNRTRLSSQHFPSNGPILSQLPHPREPLLLNAGASQPRAPSPPEADTDNPPEVGGIPPSTYPHLLPSQPGPPGAANGPMVSAMMRGAVPRHFRVMHPAMMRHPLGPRGSMPPHYMNPGPFRGMGPPPAGAHPLLRGNANGAMLNVPPRGLLNQQHFLSQPLPESDYSSSGESNKPALPDSHSQLRNVTSDYPMDMQMLLGGSIDELMQLESSSQHLSSPYSSQSDIPSKSSTEPPQRQLSDDGERTRNGPPSDSLSEAPSEVPKKNPEVSQTDNDAFILIETPIFVPQGPIKLLEVPWSLIPLDVPLKVPYPLMHLPTNLPHSHNDPRLRGSLTASVSSVIRSPPPPTTSRSVSQSSCSTLSSQPSQPSTTSTKLVDPRLCSANSQPHTAGSSDITHDEAAPTLNGDSKIIVINEPMNSRSGSPNAVSQLPATSVTLPGKSRLRLTLNENCALFRQTSSTVVSPKPPDSTNTSLTTAQSSADINNSSEIVNTDNIISSPTASWQASPLATADRSYLLDPRFKRRKTQTPTQPSSDNSITSDTINEVDTHGQTQTASSVPPLEMATENAFSDSLTESSSNDLSIHEQL